MPIETDLSVSPYFDDFDEDKRFHRVLFKPETAVQARELNQLQSILQNQIERFGSNVFRQGTVIDGCNFVFHDRYPYIKINDTQLDGLAASPADYEALFVKNNEGLTAYVLDSADGFESTDPDLKTLFVKYINSGNTGTDVAFAGGQILTVYDSNNSIHQINIVAAGSGYANSDTIVVTPTLLTNTVSGELEVGDTITDPATSASGVIVSIEDETERAADAVLSGTVQANSQTRDVIGTSTTFLADFANGDYVSIYSNSTSYEVKKINVVSNNTFMNVTTNTTFSNATATYANTTHSRQWVRYRPLPADLSNTSSTANDWTFTSGNTIVGASNTDIADIVTIVGENAAATLVTDFAGRIVEIEVTNRGNNYPRLPFVSVKSVNGSTANLVAQNYLAQITVSSQPGSVGEGYAFSIGEGVVYQKGHFIKVDPQHIVVSKYSRTPDGVAVGFHTTEELINSNQDTSLVDNSTGYPSLNAPGADRLKLTANLIVQSVNAAAANSEFLALVEWSEGYPYKQNSRTFFNSINDEMALRTMDTHGSYVVDRFLVNTQAPDDVEDSAQYFNVVVDPGTAYIDGYRVQTLSNYFIMNEKALDTRIEENAKVSLNYENYVKVEQVGGMFEFDRGNVVELYNTKTSYLSNTAAIAAGNPSPLGTKIGEARVRNFIFEQGVPGTPNAVYRLYLFDIRMNSGKNFADVRAVYQNNTAFDGIADIRLDYDPTANADIAILYGTNNKLIFDVGYSDPLNSNSIYYTYRTIDDTQEIANTGVITVSLASLPGKTFPYTGNLSDFQKSEIYLAPVSNLYSFANMSGNASTTATSTVITGTGTNFVADIKAGQYIHLYGGASNNVIRRVVSVSNATSLTVDANVSFTQTGVDLKWAWPGMVPIHLAYDTDYTANVTGANDEVLNIDLGRTLSGSSNVDVIIAYNVENEEPTPTAKTPNRNQLVKLRLANNTGGTDGPWCLGVPDIFRLRKVYVGNSTVDSSSTDVTTEFFVDHNQTANYYDLGYLYRESASTLELTDDNYLLVEYDCYTAAPGFYTVTSYVSGDKESRLEEDSKPLGDLSTTVNTFEIPELYDDKGNYYDLIRMVDFRPYVDATANITSNTSLVTTNPANTVSFSSTDRYFPVPDSIYRHDVEYFLPRTDAVVVDKTGTIKVLNGTFGSTKAPSTPAGSMRLNEISIPAYPALPEMASQDMIDLLLTGVASNKYNMKRIGRKRIRSLFNRLDFDLQQPKNHTMKDIGALERRVADLEYYAILSSLQNSVVSKSIPSSISPNIDRFKYGFFIDDYIDADYTEVMSPEINSQIIGSYATPAVVEFNTVHQGATSAAPFTDTLIISQNLATQDPVVVDPPPPDPPPPQTVATMKITPPHWTIKQYNPVSQGSFSSDNDESSGDSGFVRNEDGSVDFVNWDRGQSEGETHRERVWP